MKSLFYISGVLACTAIIFGSLFKVLHYPGGNELYILAAAILGFIYVPVFANRQFRKNA